MGVLQYLLKVEACDQPPADKILSKGTPLELAALTEADLHVVLYALKTLVSILELHLFDPCSNGVS